MRCNYSSISEFMAWMNNCIPQKTIDVISYPCCIPKYQSYSTRCHTWPLALNCWYVYALCPINIYGFVVLFFHILFFSLTVYEFIWSIHVPCLLMPWLLKSPEHQQARYWQCEIGTMQSYFIVNSYLIFCWTKSKIWYEMLIHLL